MLFRSDADSNEQCDRFSEDRRRAAHNATRNSSAPPCPVWLQYTRCTSIMDVVGTSSASSYPRSKTVRGPLRSTLFLLISPSSLPSPVSYLCAPIRTYVRARLEHGSSCSSPLAHHRAPYSTFHPLRGAGRALPRQTPSHAISTAHTSIFHLRPRLRSCARTDAL